jgi:hypothetical protein
LTRDDRAHIDQSLDDQTLVGAGERELVAELRRLAYRLDPQSVVARRGARSRSGSCRCARRRTP